jgi:hypothetical protein
VITYYSYNQQKNQTSNIKDMPVKEDESLKLMKPQNPVFSQYVMVVKYDWKYLILKINCKLVVFF